MSDDWFTAKTIQECEEMATVDCYDDDEIISGWEACLQDIFAEVKEVKLAGEKVQLAGIEQSRHAVVAVCKKKGKKIKVTLDSIELVNPTKIQTLWIEAYLDCNK